jgi:hypothetical protein
MLRQPYCNGERRRFPATEFTPGPHGGLIHNVPGNPHYDTGLSVKGPLMERVLKEKLTASSEITPDEDPDGC